MARIAVVCAALAVAGPSWAGDDGRVSIRLGGGASFPARPEGFDAAWSGRFSVAGDAGYRLSRHLTLRGGVEYARFRFDEDGALARVSAEIPFDPRLLGIVFDVSGGDATILSGAGKLEAAVLPPSASFSPYILGGVGVTRVSTGEIRLRVSALGRQFEETLEGESKTAASVSFGAGFRFRLGRSVRLYVEGQYQIAFTEDDSTQHSTVRAGLAFGL